MWRFLIHSFSSLYRCAAFLSILLLVTGPQAYAQSADGDDFEIEAWALQFRITEYFTLSSFQGGSLAVKKQRSDRSAFRFGVGLTASFSRDTNDPEATQTDRNRDSQHLQLNAQWIRYIPREGDIRPYWGVGPSLHLNRRTDNRQEADVTLGGGVNGAFGVEWFVRPQISLAAEYRAGITYRWTRDEPDRYRWTPVDSDAR